LIRTFRFYKTAAHKWYLDLPEWEGPAEELEMVEGADKMLDVVSAEAEECFLEMGNEPFAGADTLRLLADRGKTKGGGDYIMDTFKGEPIQLNMWLCEVTRSVFYGLPQIIYIGYPQLK